MATKKRTRTMLEVDLTRRVRDVLTELLLVFEGRLGETHRRSTTRLDEVVAQRAAALALAALTQGDLGPSAEGLIERVVDRVTNEATAMRGGRLASA